MVQVKVDSMQPLTPESGSFQGVVVHSVENIPTPSDKDFCPWDEFNSRACSSRKLLKVCSCLNGPVTYSVHIKCALNQLEAKWLVLKQFFIETPWFLKFPLRTFCCMLCLKGDQKFGRTDASSPVPTSLNQTVTLPQAHLQQQAFINATTMPHPYGPYGGLAFYPGAGMMAGGFPAYTTPMYQVLAVAIDL